MLTIDRSKLEIMAEQVNRGQLNLDTLDWCLSQYNISASSKLDLVQCKGLVSLVDSDADVLMVEAASK